MNNAPTTPGIRLFLSGAGKVVSSWQEPLRRKLLSTKKYTKMKQMLLFVWVACLLAACNGNKKTGGNTMDPTTTGRLNFKSGYPEVNGLKMYYEIYGRGKPLVLIHGGGSTIQTSFGSIIPFLAVHRQLIAVELQAHGRTGDRDANLSFEQDAADVVALLHHLHIAKADFLGFSNGGQTAMELALRHPEVVNKLIIASAFYKRSVVSPQFWEEFNHAKLKDMPQLLQEGQLKVNGNDTAALQNSFRKDVQRMKTFTGWTDAQLKSIEAPTLVIGGDEDIVSPESFVEMFRKIPHSKLAIFPGGHGAYLGEIMSLDGNQREQPEATVVMERFLDEK